MKSTFRPLAIGDLYGCSAVHLLEDGDPHVGFPCDANPVPLNRRPKAQLFLPSIAAQKRGAGRDVAVRTLQACVHLRIESHQHSVLRYTTSGRCADKIRSDSSQPKFHSSEEEQAYANIYLRFFICR